MSTYYTDVTTNDRQARRINVWQDAALCAQETPAWLAWPETRQIAACTKCPVAAACREHADKHESNLDPKFLSEIYAGETPTQRSRRRST